MSMHCLASLLLSAVLLLCPVDAAAEGQVHLYFFWGDGCPHCAAEREALRELEALYPQLYVHDFEVYSHPVNARLLQRVGEALRQDIGGVPFTVIADRTFVGFAPSVTLPQITGRIEECLGSTCHDSLVTLLQQSPSDSEPPPQPPAVPSSAAAIVTGTGATDILSGDISQPSSSFRFSIPLLGEIDARFISLPVLAVVMGMLDGFNPCALWTLLFLLSLLIGMTSRIRMWLLGSAFVVTSALVYFFFMTAWLQLILFLGFIFWVRLAIGGLALVGGAYSVSKGGGKGSGEPTEPHPRTDRHRGSRLRREPHRARLLRGPARRLHTDSRPQRSPAVAILRAYHSLSSLLHDRRPLRLLRNDGHTGNDRRHDEVCEDFPPGRRSADDRHRDPAHLQAGMAHVRIECTHGPTPQTAMHRRRSGGNILQAAWHPSPEA